MNKKPQAAFLDLATVGPRISMAALDALLDINYFDYSDPDQVAERIADAEVLIVNKVKLNRQLLSQAKRLKLIIVAATGTDNVDIQAAKALGIVVSNCRDYGSRSVAQHVFSLILSLNQHLSGFDRLSRDGSWSRAKSFALFDYPMRELEGRVLGFVGYGTLAKAVEELARAFGMRILISARPGLPANEIPAGRVAFETLLQEADVLSLHCPLTETNHHLIGAAELQAMKADAILINSARGGLVDGEALVQALRDGQIGGAGIDVLPVEPPPIDSPLLAADIPNLILTPHIAWATQEARQRLMDQVVENIQSFYQGQPLRRVD